MTAKACVDRTLLPGTFDLLLAFNFPATNARATVEERRSQRPAPRFKNPSCKRDLSPNGTLLKK